MEALKVIISAIALFAVYALMFVFGCILAIVYGITVAILAAVNAFGVKNNVRRNDRD